MRANFIFIFSNFTFYKRTMLKLFFIYFSFIFYLFLSLFNLYIRCILYLYEKFLWDQNNYVECLSVDDSAAKSF